MELRSLEHFQLVATLDSARSAAGVSQPAISKQLKGLEEEARRPPLRPPPHGHGSHARWPGVLRDDARDHPPSRPPRRSVLGTYGGQVKLTLAAPVSTCTDVLAPFIASGIRTIDDVRTADGHALNSLVESSVDLAVSTLRPQPTRKSRRVGSLAVVVQARDLPAAGIELISLVAHEVYVPNTGVLRTLTHFLDVPFHVVSSGPIAQSLAAVCIDTEAPASASSKPPSFTRQRPYRPPLRLLRQGTLRKRPHQGRRRRAHRLALARLRKTKRYLKILSMTATLQ